MTTDSMGKMSEQRTDKLAEMREQQSSEKPKCTCNPYDPSTIHRHSFSCPKFKEK